MEEEKKILVIIKNDNKDYHDQSDEEDDKGQMGYLPVHSQVMKIKEEFEKVKHPSPEMIRRVLRGINRQRRSRSPLGLPDQRPISVDIERNSCCV